jgi:hypothetical protein
MPQGALRKIFGRGAVLACAVLLAAGCAAKSVTRDVPPVDTKVARDREAPADTSAYDWAAAVFARGEYRRAAELFDALSADAVDPALRRRAAFGSACSLLAAVETRDDFKAAKAKWKQWEALAAAENMGSSSGEDPKMLSPWLKNLRHPAENREAAKTAKADADCAKRLAEKEKEVKLLTNQIKALEKIHREIQERKKELSSP